MSERQGPTTGRYRRADRLLEELLDVPTENRAEALERACGGDAELRAQIERLLVADARNAEFLENAATTTASAVISGLDESGRSLGPYRLLRRIGQGGMGAVYLAERTDGQFEQRVAVKLMREGLDEPEDLSRFQFERQSLAQLQHAGIARLLDGGCTADGRPFLVMEHVEGIPIDRYCAREALSIDHRLRLFLQVCAAVQYAHGQLIVHRDLKPGNILVTAQGEVRLLDFGIAKRLSPAGDPTRTRARAMTPQYASPEQVRGDAVGVATDVYSLGVLLYELLSGRLPHLHDGASPFEIERAVLEEQPVAPSLAAADPAVRRELRGDLDAIVLKTLRKEPEQRYASVALLSQDVARHLDGQPVAARRGTVAYLAGRFVRRHRFAVSAVALAIAALLLLVGRLAIQGRRLVHERDKAEQALEFLVRTFEQADPYSGGDSGDSARDVLDRSAARIADGGALAPDVQAPLLAAIGRSYLGLGVVDEGAELLHRAATLTSRDGAPAIADAAMRHELAAEALFHQGRFEEAERSWRSGLEARESAGDDARTIPALRGLGQTLEARERLQEAEALLLRALELARRVHGPNSPETAAGLRALAQVRHRQGRYDDAVALHEQAVTVEREAFGPESVSVARSLGRLAEAQTTAGKVAEAEATLRLALGIQEVKLGASHPDTAATLASLATALHYQSRLPEAEELYRAALERLRSRLGPRHPRLSDVLLRLGALVQMRDRYQEAVGVLEEALEIRKAAFGARSESVAEALTHLARSHFFRDPDKALALEAEALAIVRERFGELHPSVAMAELDTGQMLLRLGRAAEAESHLRAAAGIRERVFAEGHLERSIAQAELGACLAALGRFTEAEGLLLPAYETLLARQGEKHAYTKHVRRRVRNLYEAWEKPDRAAEYGPPRPPVHTATEE